MKIRAVERIFEIDGFFTAFHFAWDNNFVFDGERHEMWEIVFLTAGQVEAVEDEKIYTLTAGDAVIHAPMEFHRIRSSGGTSPAGCILSFTAKGELPEALKEGPFRLGDGDAVIYGKICEKIIAFVEGEETDGYAGQEAAELLSAFLVQLARGRKAESRTRTDPSADAYRRLVSCMRENVMRNLPMTEIATLSYVSVSYLKQLFRKYAGASPKEYYSNLRLAEAMHLLKEGLSATEIAERMNFSSPNYFASFFKKRTGTTPSAYRKGSI